MANFGISRGFRSSLRSATTATASTGGLGFHPVKDQFFPPPPTLFQHTKQPKTCSIIGAPLAFGQPYGGVDAAPDLLREAGLRDRLKSLGWRIDDLENLGFAELVDKIGSTIDTDQNAKNHKLVGSSCELLKNIVHEKLGQGNFPLTLGGDHSIALGSLSGVLSHRPDAGVIWVDAHADIHTPLTSESGNMHGMPVGLLLEDNGMDFSKIEGLEWLTTNPKLSPSQIVYVGLRDVDPAERALLHSHNIACYTMFDVDRYGIGGVMDRAISHLLDSDQNRPIHLSYDIDAVDPADAPSTGTSVRGGLTFREAHYVAEFVAQSGNLMSCDLVEVNPSLTGRKQSDQTVQMGLQLITSLMGKSIL